MNERKNRKFDETEAYMALQQPLELPKGTHFTYTTIDALIRRELGLNNVTFYQQRSVRYMDEVIGTRCTVNKLKNIEDYPAYVDKLYLECLDPDDVDELNGYDFMIKDYCEECKLLYGVVYVDDWNNIYMRLGPIKNKYEIREACIYYSHMPYPWHGKLQDGLHWEVMSFDKWYLHTGEKEDKVMMNLYEEAKEMYFKSLE